jgi:hypothetical protein
MNQWVRNTPQSSHILMLSEVAIETVCDGHNVSSDAARTMCGNGLQAHGWKSFTRPWPYDWWLVTSPKKQEVTTTIWRASTDTSAIHSSPWWWRWQAPLKRCPEDSHTQWAQHNSEPGLPLKIHTWVGGEAREAIAHTETYPGPSLWTIRREIITFKL